MGLVSFSLLACDNNFKKSDDITYIESSTSNIDFCRINLYAQAGGEYYYGSFTKRIGETLSSTELKAPEVFRYRYDGLFFDSLYTKPFYENIVIDSSNINTVINLYAKYSIKYYAFFENDILPMIEFYDGDLIDEPFAKKKSDGITSYKLNHWEDLNGNIIDFSKSIDKELITETKMVYDPNITFKPIWDEYEFNGHIVTEYNPDLNTICEIHYVEDCDDLSYFGTTLRIGEVLEGLYLDKEFKEPFDIKTPIKEDLSIYPKISYNYYHPIIKIEGIKSEHYYSFSSPDTNIIEMDRLVKLINDDIRIYLKDTNIEIDGIYLDSDHKIELVDDYEVNGRTTIYVTLKK